MNTTLEALLGLDEDLQSVDRAELLAANDRSLLRELVAIRKARDLTQGDVGKLMGVSQPSVAAFEAHDSNPKLSTIRRYAQAVGALIRHEVDKDEGQLQDKLQREVWTRSSGAVSHSSGSLIATFVAGSGAASFRFSSASSVRYGDSSQADFALAG